MNENYTFNQGLRNIAIIAHVDHGKTTLVDHLFRQSGAFRQHQQVSERIMDNMDLERERGITISAKNCSVFWKDTKINIIDTPGHADFGGEVERSLMMVQGAVLLVDAAEGPLPQTRFVLRKALELGLRIIVVINKIDRKDARPSEVLDEIYELFMDLDASDEQLDFPILYAVGRDGIAQPTLETPGTDLAPLFDLVLSYVPGPRSHPGKPFQMMVLNLGWSDYVGRLAVGPVVEGEAKKNDRLVRIDKDGKVITLTVVKLQEYRGIEFRDVEVAQAGDIIILAGADEMDIGDTIATQAAPIGLPRVHVDEPTIAMRFTTNTSPYTGQDGKFVQSQRIKERLFKEAKYNVALKVEETADADTFVVKGRGEFQMAILIEQMRREGFELSVGRPEVILKNVDGKMVEPYEHLVIDADEASIGVITEKCARRRGRMTNMANHGTGRVRMEFLIPSRGLIGYRTEFLTDTRGTGIMSSYLDGYREFGGEFESRVNGSIVCDRQGEANAYGLFNLESRGKMFVRPGDLVYEGMVVGEHCRDNDLDVNPTKAKKLTNIRAAGRDENIILSPVTPMTLEQAIEFIRSDELVEITPKAIRVRKAVLSRGGRRD